MDEVAKHLSNICAIDRPTLLVICVFCAIAAYSIKDFMANPMMVIFVYPMLFVLSILVKYLFIIGEVYQLKKIDQWLMWTVMAAICGNVIGITLVAGLGKLRESVRASRPARPMAGPQKRG